MSDPTNMEPISIGARAIEERDALRAENEKLQAVNDQLAQSFNDTRIVLDEAQRDLAETRRALDEARAHVAQPQGVTRRDLYIVAIAGGHWGSRPVDNIVEHADALMAAADGRKP
jgi:hypothetical protein